MRIYKARKVAYGGVLFALAMALSYLESLIPALPGLPPGIKPGLSNMVTMFCLFFIGRPSAAAVVVLKSLFSLLTRGFTAAVLSFSGGALSLAAMLLTFFLFREPPSIGFVSACGGIFHNMGQLFAAWILMGSAGLFIYTPLLMLGGLAMGLLTGAVFRTVYPFLRRFMPDEDGSMNVK